MAGFLIQRCLQALLVMLVISVIVFCGVYAIGNPMELLVPPDAPQDIKDFIIARYGLDKPLWEQYWTFLVNVLSGNFGYSFVYSMDVLDLILSRLPATFELATMAVWGGAFIGIPLGIFAGYRPNLKTSRAIMGISILGFSVPSFWVGLILILTFAVNLGWLPSGGRGETVSILGAEWSFLTLNGLSHLVLPAINLSLFHMALMIRLTRASTREAMLTDTIKFARAAGLSEVTVLTRHVLKLISIPVVTVFGLELGSTLAFAVVTESIFSWPGLGKLIIDSISNLDRPVMVAYLILVGLLFVTINLLIDLTYLVLDPRLKKGSE